MVAAGRGSLAADAGHTEQRAAKATLFVGTDTITGEVVHADIRVEGTSASRELVQTEEAHHTLNVHGVDQRLWCLDGCCANQAAITSKPRVNAADEADREKKTKVSTDGWHAQASETKAMPKQVPSNPPPGDGWVPFQEGPRGLHVCTSYRYYRYYYQHFNKTNLPYHTNCLFFLRFTRTLLQITKDAASIETFIGTIDEVARDNGVTLTREFVHEKIIAVIHEQLTKMYSDKYRAFEEGAAKVKAAVAGGDPAFVWTDIVGNATRLATLGGDLNVTGMSAVDPAAEQESGRAMEVRSFKYGDHFYTQ